MNIERNKLFSGLLQALRITISDSGDARVGPDWRHQGMCSPFSRLYYILGGEGRIWYEGGDVRLLPGHVYLIPAELTFSHGCTERMHQLFFHVNVHPSSGHELFARLKRSLCMPVEAAALRQLQDAYRSARVDSLMGVEARVRADIGAFIRLAGLEDELLRPETPFATGVYATVRQQLACTLTVKDIAARLSMSESSLAKRFRAETGMTLGRYIDAMIMQEARRQLLATGRSIGQVAESLGFCDQFYFSRYFKQRQGETPSAYRKDRAEII